MVGRSVTPVIRRGQPMNRSPNRGIQRSPSKSILSSTNASACDGSSNTSAHGGSASSVCFDRVRVHCRVRPVLPSDRVTGGDHDGRGSNKENAANPYSYNNKFDRTGVGALQVDNQNNKVICKNKTYMFDSVLGESTTNSDIYYQVAQPVCESVLEGYNGTVLCYGQTGTGKTYTLFNSPDGVIASSVKKLFENVNKDKCVTYLSVVQLYMELVQDLLSNWNGNGVHGPALTPNGPRADNWANEVRIREDPKDGIVLENAEQIRVHSAESCIRLIRDAEARRSEAATLSNNYSSRSHAVVIIKREMQTSEDQCSASRFHLVDLAGSERVKKTHAWGLRLGEARRINLSLSALGNCIAALTDANCTHIPFRDSKLTRLLQDSLGGTAKTALVVTLSPLNSDIEESASTLEFGARAMRVQNRPKIHQITDYRSLALRLQQELDKKEDEISKLVVKFSRMGGDLVSASLSVQQENLPISDGKNGNNILGLLNSKAKAVFGENKALLNEGDTKDEKGIIRGPCCREALHKVEAEFVRYLEEFEVQAAETDTEILKLRSQVRDLSESKKKSQDSNEDFRSRCSQLEDQVNERDELLARVSEVLRKQIGQCSGSDMGIPGTPGIPSTPGLISTPGTGLALNSPKQKNLKEESDIFLDTTEDEIFLDSPKRKVKIRKKSKKFLEPPTELTFQFPFSSANKLDTSTGEITTAGVSFTEISAALEQQLAQLEEFRKKFDNEIETLQRKERIARQRLQDLNKRGVVASRDFRGSLELEYSTKGVDIGVNTDLPLDDYNAHDNMPTPCDTNAGAISLSLDIQDVLRSSDASAIGSLMRGKKKLTYRELHEVNSALATKLATQERNLNHDLEQLKSELLEEQIRIAEVSQREKTYRQENVKLSETIRELELEKNALNRDNDTQNQRIDALMAEKEREYQSKLQGVEVEAKRRHDEMMLRKLEELKKEAERELQEKLNYREKHFEEERRRYQAEKHTEIEHYERSIQKQLAELECSYKDKAQEEAKRARKDIHEQFSIKEKDLVDHLENMRKDQEKQEKEWLLRERTIRLELQQEFDHRLHTSLEDRSREKDAEIQQTYLDSQMKRENEISKFKKKFYEEELPKEIEKERELFARKMQNEWEGKMRKLEIDVREEERKNQQQLASLESRSKETEFQEKLQAIKCEMENEIAEKEKQLKVDIATIERKKLQFEFDEKMLASAEDVELRLKKANDAHCLEIDTIEQRYNDEKDAAIEAVKLEMKEKEQEFMEAESTLRMEILTRNEEYDALAQASDLANQKVIKLEQKLTTTQSKVQSLQKEYEAAKDESQRQLEQKANESSSAVQNLQEEISRHVEEKSNLKGQLDVLKIELQNQRRQVDETHLVLTSRLEATESKLKSEVNEAKAVETKLQNEIKDYALMVEELENDLQNRNQVLAEQNQFLEDNRMGSMQELMLSYRELDDANQQLQEAEADQKRALTEKVANLEAQHEQDKIMIEELESLQKIQLDQIAAMSSAEKESSEKKADFEKKRRELEKQHRQELEKKREEIEQVRHELEEAQRHAGKATEQALASAATEWKQSERQWQKKTQELEEQLCKFEQEYREGRDRLEMERSSLEERLAKASAEKEKFESKYNEIEHELETIRERETQAVRQLNQELKAKANEWQVQFDSLQDVFKTTRCLLEKDTLDDSLKSLGDKLDKVNIGEDIKLNGDAADRSPLRLLAEYQDREQSWKEAVSVLDSRLNQSQELMKGSISELLEKRNELSSDLVALQRESNLQKNLVLHFTSDLRKRELAKYDEIELSKKEAEAKNLELELELSRLRDDLTGNNTELEKLNAEVESLNKKYSTLEKDKQTLKARCDKYQQEAMEKTMENDELTLVKKKLHTELEHLQAEVESLHAELNQLKKERDEIEGSRDKLEKELSESLRLQTAEKEEVLRSKETRIDELNQTIAEMSEQHNNDLMCLENDLEKQSDAKAQEAVTKVKRELQKEYQSMLEELQNLETLARKAMEQEHIENSEKLKKQHQNEVEKLEEQLEIDLTNGVQKVEAELEAKLEEVRGKEVQEKEREIERLRQHYDIIVAQYKEELASAKTECQQKLTEIQKESAEDFEEKLRQAELQHRQEMDLCRLELREEIQKETEVILKAEIDAERKRFEEEKELLERQAKSRFDKELSTERAKILKQNADDLAQQVEEAHQLAMTQLEDQKEELRKDFDLELAKLEEEHEAYDQLVAKENEEKMLELKESHKVATDYLDKKHQNDLEEQAAHLKKLHIADMEKELASLRTLHTEKLDSIFLEMADQQDRILADKMDDTQKSMQQLRTTIEDKKEEISKWAEKVDMLNAETHALKCERDEHSTTIEKLREDKSVLQKKIKDTEQILLDAEESVSKRLAECAEQVAKERDAFEEQKLVLTQERDEVGVRLAEKVSELDEQQETLHCLKREKNEEIAVLRTELSELRATTETREEQLEEQEKAFSSQKGQLVLALERTKGELEITKRELEIQKQTFQDTIEKLENEKSHQHMKVQSREKEFDTAIVAKENTIRSLEMTIAESERELEITQKKLANLEEKFVATAEEKTETICKQTTQITNLERELETGRRKWELQLEEKEIEKGRIAEAEKSRAEIHLAEARNAWLVREANLEKETLRLTSELAGAKTTMERMRLESKNAAEVSEDRANHECSRIRTELNGKICEVEAECSGRLAEMSTQIEMERENWSRERAALINDKNKVASDRKQDAELCVRLKEEIATLKGQVSHASEAQNQKEHRIELLSRENEVLVEEKDVLRKYNDDLCGEKRRLQKMLEQKDVDIDNIKRGFEQEKYERDSVIRQKEQEFSVRIDKLKSSVAAEQEEKLQIQETAHKQIEQLEAEIQTLNRNMANANADALQKEESRGKVADQLADYRKKLKKSTSLLDEITRQKKSWEEERRNIIEEKEASLCQLEEQNRKLKLENSDLRQEVTETAKLLRNHAARGLKNTSSTTDLALGSQGHQLRGNQTQAMEPLRESFKRSASQKMVGTQSKRPDRVPLAPTDVYNSSGISNRSDLENTTLDNLDADSPSFAKAMISQQLRKIKHDPDSENCRPKSSLQIPHSLSPRDNRAISQAQPRSVSTMVGRQSRRHDEPVTLRGHNGDLGRNYDLPQLSHSQLLNLSDKNVVSGLQNAYAKMDQREVQKALNTTLEAIDRNYDIAFEHDRVPDRKAYELEKAVKRLKNVLTTG